MRPLGWQAVGERVRWTDGEGPAVGSRNRSERARGAPWEPGLEGCTDGRWRTARWEAGAGGRARGRPIMTTVDLRRALGARTPW